MEKPSEIYIADGWNSKQMARYVITAMEKRETFIIFNVTEAYCKIKEWKSKLPRVQPFYDVKYDCDKSVLKLLTAMEGGFKSEEKMVYIHPMKHLNPSIYFSDERVNLLAFESESELIKIKQYYPNSKLLLRFSNSMQTLIKSEAKLECCRYSDAFKLLLIARTMRLSVVGVSFNVVESDEPYAYGRGIKNAQRLFHHGSNLGFDMNVLDIGTISRDFSQSTRIINQALNKFFPDGKSLKIIANPGKYFISSAFTLVSRVSSARRLSRNGKSHIMYFVDNGVISNETVDKPDPLDIDDKTLISCSLWGRANDGVDLMTKTVMLPKLPLPSWLLFHNCGNDAISTDEHDKPEIIQFADEATYNELCDANVSPIYLPENAPKLLSVSTPNRFYNSPLAKMKIDRLESCNGLVTPSRFKEQLQKCVNFSTPKKLLRPRDFCSPCSSFSAISSPSILTN